MQCYVSESVKLLSQLKKYSQTLAFLYVRPWTVAANITADFYEILTLPTVWLLEPTLRT